MQQDWHALFHAYQNAFNQGDAQSIAHCYHLPCLISDGDGEQCFHDSQLLTEKFSRNCHSLREQGYQRAEFEVTHDIALGDNARAVNIQWQVNLAAQAIKMNCLYVVKRVEGTWKIFCANVYQDA